MSKFWTYFKEIPTNSQKFNEPIYTHQQPQIWKRKTENLKAEKCNVALQTEHKIKWIVDNGCSKHMIGSKHFFIKLDLGKEGPVTFGNDQTTRIIGRGRSIPPKGECWDASLSPRREQWYTFPPKGLCL